MLTIAYTTSRENPHLEWFLDALHLQTGGNYDGIEVVVVDRLFGTPGRHPPCKLPMCLLHVAPKPTVWQGPHRRTKEDWFAVSNTRNTALCYARGDWIAFVDDLSFPMPGWLEQIKKAMAGTRIMCGSYQKVRRLNVNSGRLISFDEFPQGFDNRLRAAGPAVINGPVDCTGNWMYGCSVAAPVEAFLSINGYDERCDGLGFEDCITGIHLAKKGHRMAYNAAMLTLESEEDHHIGIGMKRSDYGVSPNDWSHRILELATNGDGWSPNNFGMYSNLAVMRQAIQNGGKFPVTGTPKKHWFTGTPIEQL